MFRKNQQHHQASLMSDWDLLTPKQRKRLGLSWAGVFRREVFARLDETPFAQLYTDTPSRPNIPVNVLLGLEMLKVGHGWSDADLQDAFAFDLQVRYALGYEHLGQGEFDLRTVYNFRRRLVEHMVRTGENLVERAFHQITDEQRAAFQLQTSHLRMDSTQVASNICHFSRLQLLVEILQRTYRMLTPADQALWAERFAPYIRGSSGQYIYHLRGEDRHTHLPRIGALMQQCLTELAPGYGAHATYQMLDRVFGEHFQLAAPTPDSPAPAPAVPVTALPLEVPATPAAPPPDSPAPASAVPVTALPLEAPATPAPAAALAVQVKPGTAVTADSLVSPDDPEATFRRKRSQSYLGYVTNVTETCSPANPFQLILQVQTAPNTTADADLLIAGLPELKTRTGVKFLYNDATFCGPAVDVVLREQQVIPIPSSLCGYAPNPAHLTLADFAVEHVAGVPIQIACPAGQRGVLGQGTQPNLYVGFWDGAGCAACPLQTRCPTRARARDLRPQVRFSQAELDLAQRRQRCQAYHQSRPALRAAVEATVGALKRPFANDQLPVRGLWRMGQLLIASAMMVNVRRIQRYQARPIKPQSPSAAVAGDPAAPISFLSALAHWLVDHLTCPTRRGPHPAFAF